MKERSPYNRTLICTNEEIQDYSSKLLKLYNAAGIEEIENKIINQDTLQVLPLLPKKVVDLLILDPPYNLTKNYHGNIFRAQEAVDYANWFEKVLHTVYPLLKVNASVYICSDWRTSAIIFPIVEKFFIVKNRITWEREKGRGAMYNWKNNTEDIWFCTTSEDYTFNVESVKLKRKVIAPYKNEHGIPKDWEASKQGNFRLTYPSNIWSDITIPFWSMPENTDHPTQKPEKLFAKIILASSNPSDFILDPFLGSGTSAVVAKKLNRRFCGVEHNIDYCCWAMKRLDRADTDRTIQGYFDGVFWERNSLSEQKLEIDNLNNNGRLFNV